MKRERLLLEVGFYTVLILFIIGSCTVGMSCAPQTLRRDVAQANYEEKKGLENLEAAFAEAVELQDVEKLQAVRRRLERAIKLTDEAMGAFPATDFTPTDDSYDQVLDDMAKLRKQMENLRAMLDGVKGLITKLGDAGKAVASGGFSLLSPEGGGLSALIIGFITAAITAYAQGKGKKRAQAAHADEREQHSLTNQLFGVITGQLNEMQTRQPGSQDGLLGAIAEKAGKVGVYNELEAKLDEQGHKTTRKERHNGNGSE